MAPATLWNPEEGGVPASIWLPGGAEATGVFCDLAAFDDSAVEGEVIADYTFGDFFNSAIESIDGQDVQYTFAGFPSGWSGTAAVVDGSLVVPTTPLVNSINFGPVAELGAYAVVRVGFSSFAEEDFTAEVLFSAPSGFTHGIYFTQTSGSLTASSAISTEGTENHGTTESLTACAWHELEVLVAPGEVIMTLNGGTPTVNETTTMTYPADEELGVSIECSVAGALRLSYLTLSTLPPA